MGKASTSTRVTNAPAIFGIMKLFMCCGVKNPAHRVKLECSYSTRVQAVTVLDRLSPALCLKLKTTRVCPEEKREKKFSVTGFPWLQSECREEKQTTYEPASQRAVGGSPGQYRLFFS